MTVSPAAPQPLIRCDIALIRPFSFFFKPVTILPNPYPDRLLNVTERTAALACLAFAAIAAGFLCGWIALSYWGASNLITALAINSALGLAAHAAMLIKRQIGISKGRIQKAYRPPALPFLALAVQSLARVALFGVGGYFANKKLFTDMLGAFQAQLEGASAYRVYSNPQAVALFISLGADKNKAHDKALRNTLLMLPGLSEDDNALALLKAWEQVAPGIVSEFNAYGDLLSFATYANNQKTVSYLLDFYHKAEKPRACELALDKLKIREEALGTPITEETHPAIALLQEALAAAGGSE